MKIAKPKNKGVMTLEILIAFAILILNITAVLLLLDGGQSTSLDSQTNMEAIARTQDMLARARSDADINFESVIPKNDTDGFYTRDLSVEPDPADPANEYKKLLTSSTTWKNGAKPLTIAFSTLITDFKNITDTCSQNISGDWTNPQMTPYEFGKNLVVPSDLTSGFPITDVQAIGKKLYVAVNNATANNNATFFGFDISDSSSKPNFLFGVDNAPTVSPGFNAVAINGHYAYLANAYAGSSATCATASNCSQLQIIDLDSPATPVAYLKLASTTSGGKLAYGTSIFYSKGYVFIGLAKSSGAGGEFNVVDVGAGTGSPTNPKFVTSYKTGVGINSIFVKNNYAYLATPNGGTTNENLTVLDISDPSSSVSRVYGYAPSGGSNGESIKVRNGKIYLGRTFASTADKEFYILNAPIATLINSKDVGTGSSTTIHGLVIRNTLAFLVTGAQFQIWDTNGSINQYATPLTLPGGAGTAISCTGNYLYASSVPSDGKSYISIISPS